VLLVIVVPSVSARPALAVKRIYTIRNRNATSKYGKKETIRQASPLDGFFHDAPLW
jgi:hypothetical protein